jgi:hypothetical protein
MANLGLGRIVALYHRSSLHQIHQHIRYLFSETALRPNPRQTLEQPPAWVDGLLARTVNYHTAVPLDWIAHASNIM